jgi:hypothetical protein
MLLLGSRSITIDGISVFADHADPDQFWYLPGPVSLVRRMPDRRAAFTFIKYKPAVVAKGHGGGFLMFEVGLQLDPALERRILSRLASIAKGTPRLTVVPFDEGTVRCIAFDIEGGGGTAATPPATPGAFRVTERILGSTAPSLAGANTASFSLTLTQEGATIVEKAFKEATTPVGVVYELKYSAMRPALNVKITADMKRVYEQFSANLKGQVYFISAEIEAGFEKLKQTGAIKIEVTDFVGADDKAEKEKWALDFFKEKLLSEWFTPTLTPGKLAGGGAEAKGLEEVIRTANALLPPKTAAPPKPTEVAPAKPPTPANENPRPTANTGNGDPAAKAEAPRAEERAPDKSPTAGTGLPESSPTIPKQAAGLKIPVAAPAESVASVADPKAASGSMPFGVSFKMKFVRQEEQKTIVLEYNRQEATQRAYNPSGFFGLLTADLQKSHFVEVDLDDPFFRAFEVNVDAPFEFDRIGLTSAQVALDYGEGAALKHQDLQFDKTNAVAKKWEVFMAAPNATSYRYSIQYHFSPDSGWDGETFTYDLGQASTEDRTLLLNPHNQIGFLDVQLVPDKIDWGVMESIKVVLEYTDSGGWSRSKTFLFTESTQAQRWQLRLNKRDERVYRQSFTYRLQDGTEKTAGPISTQATLVPVTDPLPGVLAIEFVPLFDKATTSTVFIDFEYADPANNYTRTARLRMPADAVDPLPLRISLFDPKQTKFRYRFTFVRGTAMDQKPFIETADTLVGVA